MQHLREVPSIDRYGLPLGRHGCLVAAPALFGSAARVAGQIEQDRAQRRAEILVELGECENRGKRQHGVSDCGAGRTAGA